MFVVGYRRIVRITVWNSHVAGTSNLSRDFDLCMIAIFIFKYQSVAAGFVAFSAPTVEPTLSGDKSKLGDVDRAKVSAAIRH